MKKVLFLVKKYQDYFQFLLTEAKNHSLSLDIYSFDDLIFEFQKEKVTITVNNKNLKEYDLIVLRNVQDIKSQVAIISQFCLDNNIKILDSFLKFNNPWDVSKSFQYAKLIKNNLPVIDSFFVSKNGFNKIESEISYPCVAKLVNMGLGEGVFLCQNKKEIIELFNQYKENLLLQKFISNEGDLRVYVIGNKVLGAIKRIKKNKNEFRNNISLGGQSSIYNLSSNLKQLSLKAAKALNYQIAGVDLVFDQNDQQWKILEVNKAPQFMGFMQTTKINVPAEIIKFFKHEAK